MNIEQNNTLSNENKNKYKTLNANNIINSNNNNSNNNTNNDNSISINKTPLINKYKNKISHNTLKSNENNKKVVVGLRNNKKSILNKNVIYKKNDDSLLNVKDINESNILNNGNNDINNENKKLKEEIKDIKEKNNLLSTENTNLKNNIIEKDKEIKKLKKQITENQKIRQIEENKLKEKINLLQKENDKIKLENQNLIAKYKELEKENNESNETIIKIQKTNPFIFYESPTLIGLENIGAKCFINATLQCLSQTKELTKFFLIKKNENRIINNNIAINNKDDCQLSPAYLELIKKLWDANGDKKYSPNAFNNNLYNLNSNFKTAKIIGAQDLIVFILQQLHKELKNVVKNNNSNNFQNLNQYDENIALNLYPLINIILPQI